MTRKRLIVIGGGAAGFFCAINAAELNPALEVIIIEKTNKLLSKVKVSGGGRCNVTHACFSITEMIKNYPRGSSFLKKAFHHFFTTDTIAWFKEKGVQLKTESDGRIFPATNSSQTIIDCLIKEANKHQVQILMNREVKKITKNDNGWSVALSDSSLQTNFICIACGGYSKLSQYQWLQELNHTIEPPVPSLFTFNMPDNDITSLMGITVEKAVVKIIGSKLSQAGPLLITHWGMSGPAILKLSAWGAKQLASNNYNFPITINWIPEYNEYSLKEKFQELRFEMAAQKMSGYSPFKLPGRLWQYLLNKAGIKDGLRWADLPSKEQNKLIISLTADQFIVKGKTTFKEEFVTAGGINLSEIDYNTMQSKIVSNLFFTGEIINVDGITGGFNFQNAWTTAWIAARAIANL